MKYYELIYKFKQYFVCFLNWVDCGGGEDDVWKTNIRYYNNTIITRLSFELLHNPILGTYIHTYIHIYIYIYIFK